MTDIAIDPDLLKAIKKKNQDSIEAAWISRIESDLEGLDWFFTVVREMRGAKMHNQAAELIALHVDALGEKGAWELAFDSLGEGLVLIPRNKLLREKAPEVVRERFADRTDLDDAMGTFDVAESEDPARTFEELREWLRFQEGAGFFLFGRGLGIVAETNLALQKVKLRFESATPLVVRRDEARKLLKWIPPDHFIMRRLENEDEVRKLAKSDPGEIIHQLVKLFRRPMLAGEIRECLGGIVGSGQWSSWWSRARAHPRVVPAKQKNAVEWSESSEAAEKSVLDGFSRAPRDEQLELARKLMKRGGEVKRFVLEELTSHVTDLAERPNASGLATALFLESQGALPDSPPVDLVEILRRHDAIDLVLEVSDRRLREKVYGRLREIRGEDWPELFRTAFFEESDYRNMTLVYDALLEAGHERVASKLVSDSVTHPRRSPRSFVWVAKNALTREELKSRVSHSMLSKVLDVLDYPEFKDLRGPLREQFEEGGIAFAVFEASDRDGVDHLLNLVDSATGLEEHRKTELRRAIFRRYPDIRKRVDEDAVFVTAESLDVRRRELENLVRVEIPQNAEAIAVAREHGDLRENFEYHAARQKHELLNARASQLDQELRKVRLIDPESVDTSKVAIGTQIALEPSSGGSVRWMTILGPWDSDPDRDVYSYGSDFAKGLLDREVGDGVELDGIDYRIAEIRVWRGTVGVSEGGTA